VLFFQFRFIIFFLVVLAVYWSLRGLRARKLWLLAVSHFFYACLFLAGPESATSDRFPLLVFWEAVATRQPLPVGWWFPAVLWASTLFDYLVGRGLGRTERPAARRAWLLVSLVSNLGVLGFFKYANFCLESVNAGLAWFGLPVSVATLSIFLPYGISFYTFQSMSYSIDVYRRQLAPVRSFLDLACFVAMFPQLVAGPIVRATAFLPQLAQLHRWAGVDVRGALALFFLGFVKKVCVSENIAPLVEAYFAQPEQYHALAAWTAVLLWSVQIYCDFSGYSDMACACARLLGFELPRNFAFPYFAASPAEFWRRWHISLSTWLRDYLYIPLGGNRGSRAKTYRNLLLTMLLGGLWHGAAWHFVAWGGAHGLALCVQRAVEGTAFFRARLWLAVRGLAGPVLTFYFICITWVLFRAPLEQAGTILRSFVLFQSDGRRGFDNAAFWLFFALAALHWLASRGVFATWWRKIPAWLFAALLGAALALALTFVPARYGSFIYFQF
jgi:alginate O-acetyltransferase complex protein AlgI